MQAKDSDKTATKGPLGWAVFGCLALVPAGLLGWFLLVRSDVSPASLDSSHASRVDVETGAAPAPDETGMGKDDRAVRDGPHSEPSGVQGRPASDLSPAARAEEARMKRFDDNALKFDRLIEAFETESQRGIDEVRSEQLQQALADEFMRLEPSVQLSSKCTASACVVEVTSDQPVGTLIINLGPWLRTHPDRAIGDPVDPEDQRALRLVFEPDEAPRSVRD